MPGFDVLDPTLDLKRNYFLEASAGTGKTFTIENIVVRLLQSGVPVERVLIVTFTRAATVELKMRIRSRLEEKKMYATLAEWDDAKIFTIHGFCFHTLKEHALETGFSLMQTEESASPEAYKRILKDFLRTGLTEEEIHPKQLEKVLKKGRNELDKLLQALSQPATQAGKSYRTVQEEIQEEIASLPWPSCVEELIAHASRFKGMCDRQKRVKPENEEGLLRLASGQIEAFIDSPLLKMVPDNLLNKQTYPDLLSQLNAKLIPLAAELSDTNLIVGRLAQRAHTYLAQVCEQEDLFFYDDLLTLMQKSVQNPLLAAAIRKGYEAVLIDEFQDTDRVQWEIFSTLFLYHIPLYLVGDPKQSIYRFRGADLYAYIEAKEAMGEEAHATLTHNFRSQPSLIEALNALFSRTAEMITLPKTGQSITIPQITAALPQTGEGKIVFCQAEEEEALFAYILTEFERLHREEGIPYRSCAVLVKDRYQAQKFCSLCHLPYATKRNESLLESDALAVLEDLLLAATYPRERSGVIRVLGGPLFGCPLEVLATEWQARVEPFYRYHALLKEQGIISFFQAVVDEVTFPSDSLYLDLWQLVEIVADHASQMEDYLPYLQKLKREDPESDLVKARLKCDEDAIQVMTLHVSKGLEFEAVFPVGLSRPSDMQEEEEVSEKMRQLYVALTRAKRYLYLPVIDQEKTPMRFFLDQVLTGSSLKQWIQGKEGFSWVSCPPAQFEKRQPLQSHPRIEAQTRTRQEFPPCAIYSYTSLTPRIEYEGGVSVPEQEMPAGSETGVLLHRIFEKLDFTLRGDSLRAFVASQLQGTHLEPWLSQVENMVVSTLSAQLPAPSGSFCLAEVDPRKMIREMEFLYASDEPAGFLKGFIDLFFEHKGHYYCVDWKSNFLENYTQESLEAAIATHHYELQARIYQSAAHKYLALFGAEGKFEGSFYLFLRGLPDKGIYFFGGF